METVKKVDIKKNRDRSTSYPSTDLQNSIELVKKLKMALGKGLYLRMDVAKGLGYSGISGSSARTISALVQYGLLDRSGDSYTISKLAEDIIHPTDEQMMNVNLIIAAKTPKLFQKIIEKFKDQPLPALLENILVKEGISSKYTKEVVDTLKKTFEFSGILKDGVILSESNDLSAADDSIQKNNLPAKKETKVYEDAGSTLVLEIGKITLIVPKNPKTTEAIIDGKLKDIKVSLMNFSKDYCDYQGSIGSEILNDK